MSRTSSQHRSRTALIGGVFIVAALLVAVLWMLGPVETDSPTSPGRPGESTARTGALPELPEPVAAEREHLTPDQPAGAGAADAADPTPLPDYPRGAVHGRLVAVDGGPLPPGLSVAASLARPYPIIEQLTVTRGARRRSLEDPHEIGSARLRRITTTAVAADGSFEMDDVPSTGAWLAVEDDRLYLAQSLVVTPNDQDEAAPEADELIVPLVRGARILGTVTSDDGQALPGAKLDGGNSIDPFAIFDSGMRIVRLRPVVADAAGRFLIGPVPVAEAVRITAQCERYEIAAADVPALPSGADHELEFTMLTGASLAGHVLSVTDEAVAGARLMLQPTELSMGNFDIMGKMLEVEETSDEHGAFLFDSLPAGSWRVRLAAAGFRSVATEPIEVGAGQDVEGLVLRAEEGLSLAGQVIDPDGVPIAEAWVEAAIPPSMISMQANMDRQYREPVQTDAEGRFEVRGYEEGNLRVWASAEGFVSAHVDAVAGDDDVIVALGRRTSITGIAIRLDDAEPLTDYKLSFLPSGGLFDLTKMFEMDDRIRNIPGGSQSVDEDGRFLVDNVTPGTYDITLRAEGYADTVLEEVVAVADKVTSGLVFLVPDEARVTGLVVSSRDGQPVEGASIITGRSDMMSRMSNTLTGGSNQATTDADGRFVLRGLGADPVNLTVSHTTHMERGLPEVTPRPGEEHDVGVISLPTGAAVWGVVRNASRDPLPDVTVMVSNNLGTTFKRTKSNAEGGYRVDGLQAGSYNVVRMDFTLDADADSATSYLDSMVMRTVSLDQDEEKRVDLEPEDAGGVRLEGTIRSDGEPEASAMVWVMGEESGTGLRMGSSDEDGHYSISGLQPGPYLVQVLPGSDVGVGSGSQPVAPVVSTVTLDDVTVHRHDIVVPGGSLRGAVVDERTGEPAGGVRVVLERTDGGLPVSRILAATGGRVGELYSDAQGKFRFGHLASGTYDVVAGGTNILGFGEAGWASTRVEGVEVTQSRSGLEVEIELRRGGGIEGVISDEDGQPLGSVPVWAREDASGRWLSLMAEVSTDSSGRYSLNSLEPGTWTLAFGGRRTALTLAPPRVVSRDRLAKLDMTLERGVEIWVDAGPYDPGELDVQVTTAGGSLPLHLTSLDELMAGQTPSGRRKVGRVARGSYDVAVFQGTTPLLQETIHITGHEPSRLLTLEP